MIILHVVAPGEFGGLERMVQLLTTGLQSRGHEVHVVSVAAEAGAAESFLAPLRAAGVRTHVIDVPSRAYPKERAAVAKLCRQVRPDVVHTHGYRPDVLDSAPARRLGIPLVTTAHGFTGGPWRNRFYEYLQRRAFRRFDAVIAVSRPLGERLARAGVPAARVHSIANAWHRNGPPLDRESARRTLGLPGEAFVIGWVGRMSREKGPDVLLNAVARLNDLPVLISMLGAGPEQAALQARAERLGAADRIRWHGAMPDAGRLFTAFDVYALSSRTEGTPVVLFEAMAAGIPVVATRVGGVPDVVSADEAVLVRSEDAIALAAAIREVYWSPAAAARRAGAARRRLEHEFAIGPWLGRYEQVYRSLARVDAGQPVHSPPRTAA